MRWDPRFATRSPLFAPIVEHARAFERFDVFPSPEAIDEALAPRAGVRFVRQEPRPRRRRAARTAESMYDARIARDGVVPTRPGSWHDLANALVWAAFPRAKRALHERQHAIVTVAPPGVSSRRTREGDCLALLDEGGVVVSSGASVVFGHAIFESIVLGRVPVLASMLELEGDRSASIDARLAAVLADRGRLVDPAELGRTSIGLGGEAADIARESPDRAAQIEPATPREKARPAG
jgi:hypothetical protein